MNVDEPRPGLQPPHVEDAVAALRTDLVFDLLAVLPAKRGRPGDAWKKMAATAASVSASASSAAFLVVLLRVSMRSMSSAPLSSGRPFRACTTIFWYDGYKMATLG